MFAINQIVSWDGVSEIRIKTSKDEGLTREELRLAVLESAGFIPSQQKILLTVRPRRAYVDDVMIPHGKIEYLDLGGDEVFPADSNVFPQ